MSVKATLVCLHDVSDPRYLGCPLMLVVVIPRSNGVNLSPLNKRKGLMTRIGGYRRVSSLLELFEPAGQEVDLRGVCDFPAVQRAPEQDGCAPRAPISASRKMRMLARPARRGGRMARDLLAVTQRERQVP